MTISAVDTTKSFLTFGERSNSNMPQGSLVRGRIASATTLEFDRVTTEGSPATITVQWQVVEYLCGVKVQRGATAVNTTAFNQTITAVASLGQAFLLFSLRQASGASGWNEDESLTGTLTSTSNVQFRATVMPGIVSVYWEVVEFTNAADVSVQRGTLTGPAMAAASASVTATIPTAVDTATTWVMAGFHADSPSNISQIGNRLLRTQLTNSTTITFDRATTTGSLIIREIAWQAVQFNDGTRVQHGTVNLAAGVGSATQTLSDTVEDARSIVVAGTAAGAGQSMGRSTYVTDDIGGTALFQLTISGPKQITAQRTATVGVADVGFQVIEFAGGCGRAKSIQRGTLTQTAVGTTTVTITAVTMSRAFLLFNTRSNSNRPVASVLKGRLASSTTLEFDRASDEASPVAIGVSWTVVEFTCGVNVQRGAATLGSNPRDVAISTVSATDQAFVTTSAGVAANGSGYNYDELHLAYLTSPTNLRIEDASGTTNTAVVDWWQVVDFLSTPDIKVQTGTTALTGVNTTVTVSLGTAVDLSRTFVLVQGGTTETTAGRIGSLLPRGRLTGTTSLTVERGAPSGAGNTSDLSTVRYQVVELKNGVDVTSGTTTIAAGQTTATAALPAIDTRYAVALASGQTGAGESSGTTPYVADDLYGVAAVTLAVNSPTQLTLTRSSSVDDATVDWSVVCFLGP